jgi:hypothetical protein
MNHVFLVRVFLWVVTDMLEEEKAETQFVVTTFRPEILEVSHIMSVKKDGGVCVAVQA